MPKKILIKTHFSFSHGYLKQLADGTLQLIDRDLTEFEEHGFDAAKRTELVTATSTFENFPTDEQMDGMKISSTAIKKQFSINMEKQMRTIFLAARNVFGQKTSIYREFGNPSLTRQTDTDLARTAKMLVTTATKYLSDLAAEGITASKISLLDAAQTSFDTAIDLQIRAVYNRDNSVEMRTKLANNLYALVVKYNNDGKDIWAEESEARYNDYVIFST